ncbi:hypothetical protein HMPREF0208_04322 [Citrobacter koseri]|nr:hypothetical protein HMPREF3207_04233 [Citrobacter koseri]KXB40450.1 hypothetical protein HMPREF0208_04322 [Citrobacter koseri]
MPPRHPRPANYSAGLAQPRSECKDYPYIIATWIIRQSALLANQLNKIFS